MPLYYSLVYPYRYRLNFVSVTCDLFDSTDKWHHSTLFNPFHALRKNVYFDGKCEQGLIVSNSKSISYFQPKFGEVSLDGDWGLLSLVEKEIPQTDADELNAIKTDIKDKLEVKAKALPDGRQSYYFDSTYLKPVFLKYSG